jgi:hypothetical protein
MILDRNLLLTIGILILCSFLFGILSIAPSIDSKHYLELAKTNFLQTRIAIISQFILIIIYIMISVLFFSIIKYQNIILSRSYLVFKIFGQVFNALGIIFIIALVSLSLNYDVSHNVQNEIVPKYGLIIKDMRDFSNHVLMVLFNSISSIILFYILIDNSLIPKWISILGVIGSGLSVIASFLICFNVVSVISAQYLLLNLPYALCEVILAVLLILKGLGKFT